MLFVDYMLKETIQSPHTSFSLPLSNKECIVVVCAVIFYFSPRVLFKFVIVLCCSVLTSPNMDEDWDLYAVVRSCKTPAITTTTTRTTSAAGPSNPANINMTNREADDSDGYFPNFDSLTFGNNENSFFIDQTLDNRNINNNPLHGDFSLMRNPSPPSTTSVSPTIGFQHQPSQFYPSTISFPVVNPQPIRPRRRKNQQNKMVRQMTQDQLSTDSWAWRKYGQKPIKGSPYPRNYYRCSTSKGCAARKQVERSPTDPNIYIVSYTGEHTHARPTHRSSLAGSTRTKFLPSTNIVAAAATTTSTSNNIGSDAIKTSCSSSSPAASGSSFSPSANTPLMDGDNNDEDNDDDDDDGVFFPNLVMDEDIFKGFGDINHGCDDDEGGVSSSLFNSPPWTPPSSSGSNIRFSGGGHD